jgi:hypothetical protein
MGRSRDLPPEQPLGRDHAPKQEWQDAQREEEGEAEVEEQGGDGLHL